MVMFGAQVCGDLSAGAAREWLVPDGTGGYAMGTVSGLRTRRYHGLLVAAEPGQPSRRHLALVALDPVLTLPSGAEIELAVHEWAGGATSPAGHTLLERFDMVDGLPRWRWRIGPVVIERELAMVHGRAHVGVVHRVLSAPGPVTLSLKALVTWRDAHGERTAAGPAPRVEAHDGGAVVEGSFRLRGPGFEQISQWYRGAYARAEAERGLPAAEDLWCAGRFTERLEPGEAIAVEAWTGTGDEARGAEWIIERARRRNRSLTHDASDATDAALVLAADAFVVGGAAGAPDVVAGYPWFGAWSRDTMTSYEGLFLATGWYDEGRELLRAYAATLDGGMLANTADTGRTEHNTVDATLWFLHAVERHVEGTGDDELAVEVLPALDEIVAAHLRGTRYGIRVDGDGLITQGAPGVALTWMDARVGEIPITPRVGKPVEVNALWINGLAAIVALKERLGRDPGALPALLDRARASFGRRFPIAGALHSAIGLPDARPLYDVVDGPGGDDPALRPNQLLAWSLPRGPMRGQAVPTEVSGLITPLGPRSLAVGEAAYIGAHRGGPAERDAAYHQGTVWPWMIGPYVDAHSATSAKNHGALLEGIEAHLWEWGVGSVSETADGDAPHRATGCPFQAWSVAEALRVRRNVG
ncbi:amylo-alpha-1,6-glucosidase [Dactylosporangium matsuzakiense]|uniref:Glycogen debranching protein n=1 Tax=Dactylosporangium matsuzakiense TaxID=53360 RepID=A0A9W6NP79_9ACTN|nr:glycogen debranching protein [Dactylosporangium matsuzakiense]